MRAFLALATLPALLVLARTAGLGWRVAFLLAAIAWGTLAVALTEVLGALCLLARTPVTLAWCVALVACGGAALVHAGALPPVARKESRDGVTRELAALLVLELLVVALLGLIAWTSAPNNSDSHTYHLARVEHWLQQRSVAHYRTGIERQVDAGPAAEFVLAHLLLLTGDDRLANLVQWFSLVGSAVAASLIGRALGARPVGQAIAAAACLSLPMAILQATSTQNDLVVSFALASFVALAIVALSAQGRTFWLLGCGAAAALGLALLTKATAYPFAAPFVAWLGGAFYRRRGARATLVLGLAGTAIVLGTCAPHAWRNRTASGGLFGPGYVRWLGSDVPYRNRDVSVGGTLSNVVRSAALELGAPDPDHLSGNVWLDLRSRRLRRAVGLPDGRRWNAALVRATSRMLRALGLDPDDPATTWGGRRFRVPASGWNFEDTAGNPLHVLLLVGVIAWSLAARDPAARGLRAYLGCVVAGFVLFNAVFAWQVYHARLQLPLLVLASAPLGVALERGLGGRRGACVAAALLVLAAPWLVHNLTRPLLGRGSVLRTPRFDQYFVQRPYLKAPFLRAAALIAGSGCRDVAVQIDNDAWEYPLWKALDVVGWRARIEHAGIENYTAALPAHACGAPTFSPCVEVRITAATVRARRVGGRTTAQNGPSAATSAMSRWRSSSDGSAIQQTTRCGWPVSTKPTRRARVGSPTWAKYALVAPASR